MIGRYQEVLLFTSKNWSWKTILDCFYLQGNTGPESTRDYYLAASLEFMSDLF